MKDNLFPCLPTPQETKPSATAEAPDGGLVVLGSGAERVPRDPLLHLLHLLEDLDVEGDQQHEGHDDLHHEVQPEDVDPDVRRVRPHARRLYGEDGVVAAAPLVLWADCGDADLEELGDVVEQGEDRHGDDEGPAGVFSPGSRVQTIELFFVFCRCI